MGRHTNSSFFHADMHRNTQKDKDIGTQQTPKGWQILGRGVAQRNPCKPRPTPRTPKGWQTKKSETKYLFCVFQRFLREIPLASCFSSISMMFFLD